MIRTIDFMDFISTVLQDEFVRLHDISVELEKLKSLTDDIEERLPSVRIDYNDEVISHFRRIDTKGIIITEKEIKIKHNSEGYTIIKRACEINKHRNSMKCIIETIKKDKDGNR